MKAIICKRVVVVGFFFCSPGSWGDSATTEDPPWTPIHYMNISSCPVTVLPIFAYLRENDRSPDNPYKKYYEKYTSKAEDPATRNKYLAYCTGMVLQPGSTQANQLLPIIDGQDISEGAGQTVEKLLTDSLGTTPGAQPSPDPIACTQVQPSTGGGLLYMWHYPSSSVYPQHSTYPGRTLYARTSPHVNCGQGKLRIRVCVTGERDTDDIEIKCYAASRPDDCPLKLTVSRQTLIDIGLVPSVVPLQFKELDNLEGCSSSHFNAAGDKSHSSEAWMVTKDGDTIKSIYVLIEDAPRHIATNDT